MGRFKSIIRLCILLGGSLCAQEDEPDLLVPEKEERIQKWLEFGKPKMFKEIPRQPLEKVPDTPINLNLTDVVSSTLRCQWDVEIAERGVLRQGGIVQASKGPFDPNIGASFENKWLVDTQVIGFKTGKNGNFDSTTVFLEKLARIGTLFRLDGAIQREFNPSLSFDDTFTRTNQTTISFSIDQPLLKRFRYNEDSVNEIVNELELKALKNELIQTMATNIRSSLNQYWNLVAAEEIVTINKNLNKILDGLTSATEKLVEGERVAKSELNQQFAELARNHRELIASQQDAFAAYNNLLLVMGMRREKFQLETPELELEPFPDFKVKKEDWDLGHLLNVAVQNRGDYIAAQVRVTESQMRLRLAEQNIYPNLNLQASYDLFNNEIGRKSRPFFSSAKSHLAQKDYAVGISFSVPIFNNRARGERVRREEEKCQSILEEDQLYESIRTEITTAYRNQLELIDQYYYAQKTVKWYEKALKDEILRFKEGFGTLFVVIDFENRMRRSLIEQINVHNLWAQNIVELLFLTGTLVTKAPCSDKVDVSMMNYKNLLQIKIDGQEEEEED